MIRCTRNQPTAQTSPAARAAAFILAEAGNLGIAIGTDGVSEIVMIAPLKVPREVRRQFEALLDEFGPEVIDIIQQENAARMNRRDEQNAQGA